MTKEKLTLQRIKQDLKKERKGEYMDLFGFSFFFAVFLVIFLVSINSDDALVIYQVMFGVSTLLTLLLLVLTVIKVIRFSNLSQIGERVTKDTMVDRSVKERRYSREYRLRFANYGECDVERWVYDYSHIGDTFYLVLSKPHAGKILLAYCADLYEWEG